MTELIGFAEVMARKQNCVELDSDGNYFVSATGPIEEVIPMMQRQLLKLERIKKDSLD